LFEDTTGTNSPFSPEHKNTGTKGKNRGGMKGLFSSSVQGLGSVPDGVDKLKGLIEAVFCFEPIRDKTLSSLVVKSEQ